MLDILKRVKEYIPIFEDDDDSEKENFVVALDIGTENVKALIAKINDENVEIVGVGRAHQGLQDMQSGAIADIAAVAANCNSALSQAEEQAGVSPRAVVVGLAGELVKGTTTKVRVRRADGKAPLDVDEIEQIIERVQTRAKEQSARKIKQELGGKDVDIQLINSALVSMEIDGYVVTNPVGFQGKEVTVQLYTAFAPLIHIGAIERVVQQLDMDLIAVAAEPFAVARSVLGDNEESTLSAVLMDIGGGTTDIAVIDEGGVQGTKMFGIGGRAFTKAISRDLSIPHDQAENLKIAFGKGAVPEKQRKKLVDSLESITDVWQSGVELALEEFTALEHLPHHIFLYGGGASLSVLFEELEKQDWYKELPFTRKPTVKYINPATINGIVDTTEKIKDHTFITAMGLLRVGVDTIEQDNDDDSPKGSIRQKINRILRS